ncbi:MAG TPA: nucleoid-structuring protein H-NS [Cyclobacteriaceae bacterium]|nr:nucleoid-structuring protein H-NS [Cyclobacteriaceae bacterium]
MVSNRISRRVTMWALIIMLMAGGVSCKSKKAAMDATDAAAEKAKMEQEAALRKQQEEEAKKQLEMEEEARKLEARRKAAEPYQKLENYFASISNSNNVAAANSSIKEALSLFASKDTPVLIVISEEGGQKDYDRPTTIGEYLNYLKDQKKNINKINQLQFDSSGKITEVELVKN